MKHLPGLGSAADLSTGGTLSDIMLSHGLPTPVPTPREPDPDLIKPIETRYAGCRFRSRLEARWAVFFDTLGIEWQYEPECYKIGGKGYLPDFWLPELAVWVEVKGVLDEATLEHLAQAVNPICGLPRNPSGERWKPSRRTGRLLLLGQVPKTRFNGWTHNRLDFAEGEVCVREVIFQHDGTRASLLPIGEGASLMSDNGAAEWSSEVDRRDLLTGGDAWFITSDPPVTGGYDAARMARFEHGESGYDKSREPKPLKRAAKRVPKRASAPRQSTTPQILLDEPVSRFEGMPLAPSPTERPIPARQRTRRPKGE